MHQKPQASLPTAVLQVCINLDEHTVPDDNDKLLIYINPACLPVQYGTIQYTYSTTRIALGAVRCVNIFCFIDLLLLFCRRMNNIFLFLTLVLQAATTHASGATANRSSKRQSWYCIVSASNI